jgi:hypothetical protein
MRLNEYIIQDLFSDAEYYSEEERHFFITYFPRLSRAYVEYETETYWFDAAGINHALEQFKEESIHVTQ